MTRPGGSAQEKADTAKTRLGAQLASNAASRVLLTYGAAAAAGLAAARSGMPLPWMLGPFFLIGGLSALGFRMKLIPMGRELGQVAIGLAIGLRFTPAVLLATISLIPAMLLGTAYIIVFTMIAAFIMKAIAGVDDATAFFATAAGGVADMAHVSERYGGSPTSVAIVHAMRVSCVVAIVPFVVYFLGERGPPDAGVSENPASMIILAASLLFALAVAFLLKPTPLPNPWLVGPILAGMVLGLSGIAKFTVPASLIVLAQVMLGAWLGSQFKRELIAKLPRVSACALVIALFMILCAATGASVLTGMTRLPFSTTFLALAPAAVAEMVITAKILHLDAEIVTAFHIMRIAVVSSSVLLVFRLYEAIGRRLHGPRI